MKILPIPLVYIEQTRFNKCIYEFFAGRWYFYKIYWRIEALIILRLYGMEYWQSSCVLC